VSMLAATLLAWRVRGCSEFHTAPCPWTLRCGGVPGKRREARSGLGAAQACKRGENLRGGRGMGGSAARLLGWALAAAALGAACLPGGARAQQLPNGTYPPVDPALYAPLQLVGATTGVCPDLGCLIVGAGLRE